MDEASPTVLNYGTAAPASLAEAPPPAMSLQRYMTLVGWGLLVTTLGQMQSLGEKPIRFLLKDQLGLSATQMAMWLWVAILPWSLKPIAGLLSDALPLFGSRRKYYLMLSSLLAGLLWFGMSIVPRHFYPLMVTAFLFNVMAVIASVVTGGLLVEGAQSHRATGRLSSLRLVIINITYVVAGPVSGFLAGRWFGWTSIVCGALFLSLPPVVLMLLRELPQPRRPDAPAALWEVWRQIKSLLPWNCWTLWIVGGLFFLIQVAPGLYTPLFYYQTNTLKFTPQFIGNLGMIYGGMGLLGSFIYPFVCKRFRLRALLALAIVCTIASNMAYLGYVSRHTAMIIEGSAGLGLTLAQLPLFDLAARATPRGSEALAYSLMIACWNWGLSLSDVLGSWLFDKFNQTFMNLVWVNAGTTALVLVVVPFLPRHLVDRKEGESLIAP
ncbi:MAG: MFS transporter [Tepidisphaerales bacterium]